MKTAMQNVLDLVQKRLNEFDGLNGFEVTMMKQELNWFKDILTNKLEEEKEQIIEAYNQADLDGYFQKTYPKYAEQYYNKTYNQNK
jgi:hypothetical protein